MLTKRNIVMLAATVVTLVGCIKAKKNNIQEQVDTPESPVSDEPINVTKSEKGLLNVSVTIRYDGMLLNISNVPDGATLECDLDDKPLVPCHDGAFFLRPENGDHVVTAIALKNGNLVSAGESRLFTVSPLSESLSESPDESSLVLVMNDATFSNAMALPIAKDFTAQFKFATAKQPADCKAELRCKYDSRTSQFWTTCDKAASSYTVSKDIMALGLQYLSVQATCSDRIGPILTVFWYGVPEKYQPLMLQPVSDPSGRAIVSLVRDADCPEGQQIFECAADANTAFNKCETGNSLAAPKKGFRVRMQCDSQTGPEYTFE